MCIIYVLFLLLLLLIVFRIFDSKTHMNVVHGLIYMAAVAVMAIARNLMFVQFCALSIFRVQSSKNNTTTATTSGATVQPKWKTKKKKNKKINACTPKRLIQERCLMPICVPSQMYSVQSSSWWLENFARLIQNYGEQQLNRKKKFVVVFFLFSVLLLGSLGPLKSNNDDIGATTM